MSPDEYKRILAKYLPAEAVEPIYDFFDRHGIFLHITRRRQSKLGDYRWPQNGRNYHAISVNGDLNSYHFLLVLLHEMAHFDTHQAYGTNVQPHGHEWQEAYRRLLLQYLGIFPDDVASILKRYTARIPLSRTVEKELDVQIRHYNPGYTPATDITLDQLPAGTDFRIVAKPQKPFRSIERRRTRWICLGLDDNRRYLVSGSAIVEMIKG